MSRTYSPKLGEVERNWFVVDATGLALGRLSTEVARVLTGKHKPQYAMHMDSGDFVVVLNAEKVILTGRKQGQKVYYKHTGRPGSLQSETADELLNRRPELLVERAVKGMLPKNRLGRQQFTKLKVYAGGEHPHAAQQPQSLNLGAV
ncbi:MAG: 50S ribosomal protein L13 [Thermoanaerobaculia bacterium]|nr:50S ribosomal protein L13 [Thermoanaerobaculia bacterium]